ncbi:hypothetical protein N9C24_02050 [Gammaproteobacteria bacterium]|nr:hypothetical protein [Gammaproteobacteria bacterium]
MNNDNNINKKPSLNDFEPSILTKSILKNFKKIILINFFIVIFAVFFSLSLKNIYQSEIKLILKQDIQSPISGIRMALPINIGSSSGYEINLIRSILSSRDFFKILYEDDSFIALIDAIHRYDEKTKKIVFDSEKINKNGDWIVLNGSSLKPSFEKSYKSFKGYFSSSVDQSSGIVNLNFEHVSPYESKILLEKIYLDLNAYLKDLKLHEIERKINFLNKSYSEAAIQDIKKNISSLLQNEIESKAILLSRENIYFDLIDSSSKGIRVAPKRSLIVLLISTICFVLSILFYLIRYFNNHAK